MASRIDTHAPHNVQRPDTNVGVKNGGAIGARDAKGFLTTSPAFARVKLEVGEDFTRTASFAGADKFLAADSYERALG